MTNQIGGQKEVAPGWFVGASAGYETSWLLGDDDSSKVSGQFALSGVMVMLANGQGDPTPNADLSKHPFNKMQGTALPGAFLANGGGATPVSSNGVSWNTDMALAQGSDDGLGHVPNGRDIQLPVQHIQARTAEVSADDERVVFDTGHGDLIEPQHALLRSAATFAPVYVRGCIGRCRLHNFHLECGARIHKLRVYETMIEPTGREGITSVGNRRRFNTVAPREAA